MESRQGSFFSSKLHGFNKSKAVISKGNNQKGSEMISFPKHEGRKTGKPVCITWDFPGHESFPCIWTCLKKDCATLHQPVWYCQPAKVPNANCSCNLFGCQVDISKLPPMYCGCFRGCWVRWGLHSSMNRMSADRQGWRTFFVIQKTRHWRNFLGSGKLGALEQRWTSLWECWEHTVHLILKLDSFSNRMRGKKKDQPLPIFLLTSH